MAFSRESERSSPSTSRARPEEVFLVLGPAAFGVRAAEAGAWFPLALTVPLPLGRVLLAPVPVPFPVPDLAPDLAPVLGLLGRGKERESLETPLEGIPVAGKERIVVADPLGPEEATPGTGCCTLEWAVVVLGGDGGERRKRHGSCSGRRILRSRGREGRRH